jgi:hypothetical protein
MCVEILKQMAPGDAQFLDKLFDWCEAHPRRPINWNLIYSIANEGKLKSEAQAAANLVRLGLIVSDYVLVSDGGSVRFAGTRGRAQAAQMVSQPRPRLREKDELSEVAVKFVKACPEPRVESKNKDPI